ncbi:unnamed protein product, partial [Urochloa humidicola]
VRSLAGLGWAPNPSRAEAHKPARRCASSSSSSSFRRSCSPPPPSRGTQPPTARRGALHDDGRDLKDADFYKQQAKQLFKNLSKGQHEASRMSIETGPYLFHYIIEGRVCYLTLCDRSYPKKLAFQYLEDLKNEFEKVNGSQIETAARPYAFIKFDAFIQKTKKLYLDTRTQRNLAKLNDELYEVHQIMTRNVQEVLGVGEKLDQVSEMSSRLTSDTRIYAEKAKDLNRQALIRKYAPVAIVIGIVLMLFWVKNKIW